MMVWVLLFCFPAPCTFATNSSIKIAEMIAAGYADSEIKGILSGEKTVAEINWRIKMRAMGYSDQQIKEREMKKQVMAVSVIEKSVKNAGQALLETQNHEGVIMQIIAEACAQNDIAISFFKALIKAESNFNPRAVSLKGAKGLTQLMPETASLMGVRDVFNPIQNIHGGAKYLAMQMRKFGSKELALAAYNAGPGTIKNERIPNIEETKIFIKRVLHYERQYSF